MFEEDAISTAKVFAHCVSRVFDRPFERAAYRHMRIRSGLGASTDGRNCSDLRGFHYPDPELVPLSKLFENGLSAPKFEQKHKATG